MIAGIVAPDAGSNFSHIDGVIVALLPDCTPMRYSYSRRYGHRIKRPPLSLPCKTKYILVVYNAVN